MARKPDFITFTGADDDTSVAGMLELAQCYPIEWGILFSPKRQGLDNRYPRFHNAFCGLRLSAHLCGEAARTLGAGIDLGPFTRVQINHREPFSLAIADRFRETHLRPIAQWRELEFPDEPIDWLFDKSGGNGIAPSRWPPHPGRFVGYAGGIRPANVLSVIEAIDAPGPYWIDMESGVRTDDHFDLDLCRQVCEQVYGRTLHPHDCAEGK